MNIDLRYTHHMNITQQHIDALIDLTDTSSKAIIEIYNADTAVVEYKTDNSPLTQADTASHDIIVSGLQRLFPEIPVVSEEGSEADNQQLIANPLFWLVDPIDGTQDFVNRTGDFCIALALVQNSTPVFGFVAAPTYDTIYFGGPSYGSFKKVGTAQPQPIHVSRLDPHVIAMSRSHAIAETKEYIEKHYPNAELKQIGSMLKQMKLAEGEVDIYPAIGQPLHLWDAAAGQAIIEGAGGTMTKLDGSPLDFTRSDLLVGDFIARGFDQSAE